MVANKDVETLLGEPKKAILSMVAPILIAMIVGQVNSFVDSMWCSSLGVNALSAISLVSSLYFLILGIGNGVGVGINVSISRKIGAGDIEGAQAYLAQIFVLMVVLSIPMIPVLLLVSDPLVIFLGGSEILAECHDYLIPIFLLCTFTILQGILAGAMRGEGAAKRSSKINMLSAVVNIILDPVLIFGLNLGLMGASLATMLSGVSAAAMMLHYYTSKKSYVPFSLKNFRFRRGPIWDVMYVGIPEMLELNIMSVMNLALVSLVIGCGGSEGLTLYNTPWRFVSLVMVPAMALSSAMVPVCSAAIGQRRPEKLREGYYFTVKSAAGFGVAITILVFLLSNWIVLAFTYDPSMEAYRSEMARVTRIYALFMPWYGLIKVGSSMLSALRKSSHSLACAFLRNVLLICIFYVASFHDMDWFYWGLTIGEIIGGIMMLGLAQFHFRNIYRDLKASQSGAEPQAGIRT